MSPRRPGSRCELSTLLPDARGAARGGRALDRQRVDAAPVSADAGRGRRGVSGRRRRVRGASWSRAGACALAARRKVRGFRRGERLAAIRKALRTELPELDEEELRRAEAVIAYLHNMLTFTTMRE